MIKTLKSKPLYRAATIEREHINEEERTIELSFSSEEPVERFFGIEILDHNPESVRLERLASGGPVLVDHTSSDHVGVVESVTIGDDRRGRALVRFGKSARADEVFNDVKDGIRRNVSVGYRVHKAVLEETGEDTPDIYRVNDWEPFEISMVAVPADPTVGVGRSMTENDFEIVQPETKQEDRKMEDDDKKAAPDTVAIRSEGHNEGVEKERRRVTDINALGDQYECRDLAAKYIAEGKSVDEMTRAILADIREKQKEIQTDPGKLDMPEKDKRSYSLLRAIKAARDNDWSKAGLEREASDAIAERMGEPQGFYVPNDIGWVDKRVLTVGTATAGGYLKGTDHLGDEFIDALRPALVLASLGAQIWDGLVGDLDVPALNAKTQTYWVAEDGAPTAGAPTFRQVTLAPKTVAAYVDLSRRLMNQSSPSVEQVIRNDLIMQVASAIDTVGINGGGSNEPTGILQTTGIGAVALGTNGAAPTFASQSALLKEVDIDDALMGNLAYLTNPKVTHTLRTTAKVASTDSVMILGDTGELFGYQVAVTNNVPSNLTKGTGTNLSAEIFGNFNDLIIGEWGAMDVLVDPYSLSTKGGTRVTIFKDVDIAVRHAQSFAAIQDMITT